MAANGIALTILEKNALRIKRMATNTLVSPVRPPIAMPDALSTNVVVFDVPNSAPTDIATASDISALSILESKHTSQSIGIFSPEQKMPNLSPVPRNVPIVSKMSVRLNAMIVTRTIGTLPASVNSDGIPSDLKITPKVEESDCAASEKLTVTRMHRNAVVRGQ